MYKQSNDDTKGEWRSRAVNLIAVNSTIDTVKVRLIKYSISAMWNSHGE